MTVDWKRIEQQLHDVTWKMLNEEGKRYGPGFHTEALQRTLGYKPAEQGGVDHLDYRLGLTTHDEHIRDRDGVCAHADMLREQAEQQTSELRTEVRRIYREARRDIADELRKLAGRVDSKYRREGVELAADAIDPRVPKP